MITQKTKDLAIFAIDMVKDKLLLGWTQGKFARDKDGNGVRYSSNEAVCWCLLGAQCCVLAANEKMFDRSVVDILSNGRESVITELTGAAWGVADWNDFPGRTKEEVIALVDSVRKKILEMPVDPGSLAPISNNEGDRIPLKANMLPKHIPVETRVIRSIVEHIQPWNGFPISETERNMTLEFGMAELLENPNLDHWSSVTGDMLILIERSRSASSGDTFAVYDTKIVRAEMHFRPKG